ncbi:XRE family transcriptional regulator [Sphingobium cloacae]|uniref:XRE family transcriptional regulator n=1 Tax=Sphingobium cloacae TaxID=120107 RepID=UPI000A065767|nr:XRE family transcriptional regulator [Sphingobium cloacae]
MAATAFVRARITARVKSWDVPQGQVAKRLGLTRLRLNDLLRGKFNGFSLDDLMTIATAAGVEPPAARKSSWDDLRGMGSVLAEGGMTP